jgi:chromosome segregation ATPase
MDKDEVILKMLTEVKDDMKSLRESNHAIRGELGNVSGSLQLLRQELNTQKTDNKERFERVHNRIDSELETMRTLEKELNKISPKVNEISQSFNWAKRIVVTALVGGLLWASVQAFISK